MNELKKNVAGNALLILLLGACPAMGATTTVLGAAGIGIAVLAVMLLSCILLTALKKAIPECARVPAAVLVIAGFASLVQMVMHATMPELYDLLGVYLALITVNCIILGRAEMFAGKNAVGKSALDGVGMGLGFTLALLMMATVREVLGAGSFAGIEIPFMVDHSISFFVKAPGGMLVYGCLIALVYKITKGKGPKKKSFSCAGCPSAGMCHTGSCQNASAENEQNGEKEETANV